MASGGKPKGVYVVTDAELEGSVGGVFTVQPGPAIRVAALDSDVRGVTGGNIAAVYVVDAAEAARRGVAGGKSTPVVDMTSSVRKVTGPHVATPVYVMSGSLGGGVTPTPPVPPVPPAPAAELIETFFGDATIAVQGNQEKDIDEYWGSIIV